MHWIHAKPGVQVLQLTKNSSKNCVCPFIGRAYHKKEGRKDEGGIYIPLFYSVELLSTKEEKKLERTTINFRRKEYFSEKE